MSRSLEKCSLYSALPRIQESCSYHSSESAAWLSDSESMLSTAADLEACFITGVEMSHKDGKLSVWTDRSHSTSSVAIDALLHIRTSSVLPAPLPVSSSDTLCSQAFGALSNHPTALCTAATAATWKDVFNTVLGHADRHTLNKAPRLPQTAVAASSPWRALCFGKPAARVSDSQPGTCILGQYHVHKALFQDQIEAGIVTVPARKTPAKGRKHSCKQNLIEQHTTYSDQHSSASCDDPVVLEMEVGLDEVDAVEPLIDFIHMGTLPSPLTTSCLLRLVALCLRCKFADCATAAASQLHQSLQLLPPQERLSLAVKIVRCLDSPNPPAAAATKGPTAPAVSDLLHSAKDSASFVLLDLEAAWQEAELRLVVVSLPLPLLTHLLSHPNLKASSENVVLVALTSWLYANCTSQRAREEAAAHLVPLLRLPMLSGSFLSQVVPRLTWLRHTPAAAALLQQATQYWKAGGTLKQAIQQGGTGARETAAAVASSSGGGSCGCSSSTTTTTTTSSGSSNCEGNLMFRERPWESSSPQYFSCCFSLADITHAACLADTSQMQQTLASDMWHFKGCRLQLQLHISPQGAIDPARGRVYGGIAWWVGLHPPGLYETLGLDSGCQLLLDVEVAGLGPAAQHLLHSGQFLAAAGRCCGWPEFLGGGGSGEWRRLADEDGDLVLGVTLLNCE